MSWWEAYTCSRLVREVHVVALTVPGARGALRRRAAEARARLARRVAAVAAQARRAAAAAGAALLAMQAVAGLALVAFGAWLAWHPAGFIVAGVGLLADRLLDERAP